PAGTALEPSAELPLHDLRERLLGLALVARRGLEQRTLLLDLGRRELVLAEDTRTGERDVERDLTGELVVTARQLDQHAVHATVVLHVQVRAHDVARRRIDTRRAAPVDVLLQADLQLVELVLERR